jgi:hypothetical protein
MSTVFSLMIQRILHKEPYNVSIVLLLSFVFALCKYLFYNKIGMKIYFETGV